MQLGLAQSAERGGRQHFGHCGTLAHVSLRHGALAVRIADGLSV